MVSAVAGDYWKFTNLYEVCKARIRAKMLIQQMKEIGNSINSFQHNEDMALGLLRGL